MHMHWKVLFAHVHLWPPTAAVCESDHSAFPAHPPTTTGMIADLRAASVQRIDPTDGYAPKSCLPKCLTLSLVWKDRDPETFVFEYLASGAYRDAFESPAAKLLFKAHLPLGLDYQKVKGSETNEEEYALALKSDNHGLPIPHVHGLVQVRVQGWAGVVDYQLLFMERIDFTFAEWMRAHENTPPADGHLQRVVAMLIVTVRVMSRLVNPPYNYELADWHCGNFAFREAVNGALTFYLVDFQLNGAAEELRLETTMSTGRRRMKPAYSTLIASLKSAEFLTVTVWKLWLSHFAGVLEAVWTDTWDSGWGKVYGEAEFQRLQTTMEQSLPAAEVPAPHDPSMESSVDADACSPPPPPPPSPPPPSDLFRCRAAVVFINAQGGSRCLGAACGPGTTLPFDGVLGGRGCTFPSAEDLFRCPGAACGREAAALRGQRLAQPGGYGVVRVGLAAVAEHSGHCAPAAGPRRRRLPFWPGVECSCTRALGMDSHGPVEAWAQPWQVVHAVGGPVGSRCMASEPARQSSTISCRLYQGGGDPPAEGFSRVIMVRRCSEVLHVLAVTLSLRALPVEVRTGHATRRRSWTTSASWSECSCTASGPALHSGLSPMCLTSSRGRRCS